MHIIIGDDNWPLSWWSTEKGNTRQLTLASLFSNHFLWHGLNEYSITREALDSGMVIFFVIRDVYLYAADNGNNIAFIYFIVQPWKSNRETVFQNNNNTKPSVPVFGVGYMNQKRITPDRAHGSAFSTHSYRAICLH